ncbi:exonuclease domain-containing protein [Microbacterium sp. LRZ72]|uniref:3'-5' exonuclease n=1 Tax=Microbacterium sp. LRZ72 TaxID=2942481 RepID=UPI00299FA2B9|nr:exonuclease domain-containing protein [Microbacterium sp. LRZ72]MDX2375202.1 exonuclease domain-containing protein [Microbacterium sp. LRZ72]
MIDLETTGLFPEQHDRIVEVAIVHVSPDGIVEGAWETLVNPMRDMGAQRIHGISASAASRAPAFEAVAPDLGRLMRGRVPVAHNARFDARFLGHSMTTVGEFCPDTDRWMCTMQLASTFLPGRRSLADCSAAIGSVIEDAHRASADALATATLLRAYIGAGHDPAWWDAWLRSAGEGPLTVEHPVGWIPREAADAAPRSILERLPVRVDAGSDDRALNVDYLALLDRVLLDQHMSTTEADDLLRFAQGIGMSPAGMRRTHRAYFDGLVSAAWADDELTAREWDDIQAIGGVLEIEADVIASAAAQPAVAAPSFTSSFRLAIGDTVVVTGATRRDRAEWLAILDGMGFVAKDSMVKTAKVLVAADADSMSSKAKKARAWGIPIITEDGLERMLGLEQP